MVFIWSKLPGLPPTNSFSPKSYNNDCKKNSINIFLNLGFFFPNLKAQLAPFKTL